ncbi:hypothetical protein [Parasediminibacterium sp. JCM 36343]|uniref:hypothetical protein n=1 Tax=Parasediminibacterium sp. JCM 36343 TaxID=3374279 RepID=UPI0039784D21
MKNTNRIIVYLLLAAAIVSCTATKIDTTWKEPNKAVSIDALNKVLVVAFFKTITESHKAEDEMAKYLNHKGIVSYSYLNDSISTSNEKVIREKIKADGFDGAVTMRLIDVDKERVYTPGNIQTYPVYLSNFSGYYHRSFAYYQQPGYYATTKTYTVETNVFSIKEDKIIWTALTKTTNPNGVKKMSAEISEVVYRQMIKEGFLTK